MGVLNYTCTYCLYTFERVLCNIRYFRFHYYKLMKRMYQDFANTFSIFRIAELQLGKPDHRNNRCPYICRFKRLCTVKCNMNHSTSFLSLLE